MDIMEDLPDRCDHPMNCLELVVAKVERAPSCTPVLSTSHAIVHCHKCGKDMQMISDYGDWHDRHEDIEIVLRCTGYMG